MASPRPELIVNPNTAPRIAMLMGRLPQGLLLTGDDGTGLRSLAYELARSMTKNVLEVVPDKGVITIESIRELYAVAKTNTGSGVILIDDADTMGREASNALLKLLEEPGENLRFILTSHAPDALLPTIVSRVQVLVVPRVTPEQSDNLLTKLDITDAKKRSQLTFIAGGLAAAMTRLSNDDALFNARSKTVRDARQFLSGSREDRLVLAASYGTDRPAATALVRDMMKLVRLSARASVTRSTLATIDVLLAAERDLTENSSVRLTLTHAALSL